MAEAPSTRSVLGVRGGRSTYTKSAIRLWSRGFPDALVPLREPFGGSSECSLRSSSELWNDPEVSPVLPRPQQSPLELSGFSATVRKRSCDYKLATALDDSDCYSAECP
eukprot:15035542-Alexandrium_andersonii.AAC.1